MKPPVIFLHIPKTAGTTMRSILARTYRQSRSFEIENDINRFIEMFRDLPQTDRQQLALLQGHMSYGLHRYLADGSTYVTMLREPIARAISDYAFVSNNTLHPLYPAVSAMSIGEYFNSNLTGQLSNGQVRLVSGDSGDLGIGIPTLREMTSSDLDLARQHIQSTFSVVGLQERFDESLIMMRRQLGWRLPFYVRENVTHRANKPTVSETDLQQIQRQNTLDIAFYNETLSRFDALVAQAGLSFKFELMAFRILNKAYGTFRLTDARYLRSRLGPIVRRYFPRQP